MAISPSKSMLKTVFIISYFKVAVQALFCQKCRQNRRLNIVNSKSKFRSDERVEFAPKFAHLYKIPSVAVATPFRASGF